MPKEITLLELRETLADILGCEEPDRIRVREKQHNGFFGKIFREGKKTLK